MRRLGAKSKKAYILSTWLVPSLPLVIALVTWVNGLDGTEAWLSKHANVFGVIRRVQEVSIWLYAICWVLFPFAVWYKRKGDPWLVEKIQFILDRYQQGAFDLGGLETDPPKDHNRVTLFRHQKGFFVRHWSKKVWFWPWGNHGPLCDFLVPVMRSGHMSKKTSIAFFVSDDSDKTEGIAGQAYASGSAVYVANLPEMNSTTGSRNKRDYAERTYCDTQMIDSYISKERPMPRSVVAIPVERHGIIWGVIVLDSRYPYGVTESAVENYRLTVALIGHLLERAS